MDPCNGLQSFSTTTTTTKILQKKVYDFEKLKGRYKPTLKFSNPAKYFLLYYYKRVAGLIGDGKQLPFFPLQLKLTFLEGNLS